MTYGQALVLDVGTLLVCALLLVRSANLRHSHPAVVYYLFHLFSFTGRTIGLLQGAEPLYGFGGGTLVPHGIIRASANTPVAK